MADHLQQYRIDHAEDGIVALDRLAFFLEDFDDDAVERTDDLARANRGLGRLEFVLVDFQLRSQVVPFPRCNGVPVAAQRRAILPVFGGISGSQRAMWMVMFRVFVSFSPGS